MYKISFPHIGKYHIPIKKMIENLVGDYGKVILAPPITKKTIELGTKHSPEFVCVPFKYNLGNFIEALDNGANVIIQTNGDCRMGFYSEVQEQILQDLGYDFELCIIETNSRNRSLKDFFNTFKKMNPKLTYAKTIKTIALAIRIIFAMDKIEQYVRENVGFEVKKGLLEKVENEFLRKIGKADTLLQVEVLYRHYYKLIKKVKINKPENLMKVGVVGELYVLMEPFSNYFIEKELAKYGVQITRYINVSYLLFSPQHKIKNLLKEADGYVTYEIGADGTDSVAKTVKFAKQGYDGILHLKPFGCTPEVNSIPIVQKAADDFGIPVLYFSFDSQTSETGIKTRLEAFYDMLLMKKEGKKEGKNI